MKQSGRNYCVSVLLHIATALLMLCSLLSFALAEKNEQTEKNLPWLDLNTPVKEGDQILTFQIIKPVENLRLNVFTGNEDLTDTAERDDISVTVTLQRALKAEDVLLIVAEGTNALGQTITYRLNVPVINMFQQKLPILRSRVDSMWDLWWNNWRMMFEEGSVYLPKLWKYVPFRTWPDEAPELIVTEADERFLLHFSENIPEDWHVQVGVNIPVEYTDCTWDESAGVWVAECAFDSVYLISDMAEKRIGITIEYPAINEYLASYPVLDWAWDFGDHVSGFNCYGWGNARSFDGAMLCQVSSQEQWYAEYGTDGILSSYYALHLDCRYDADDHLLSGHPPEGYIPPVLH